jgi:kinetochore protein NDC80
LQNPSNRDFQNIFKFIFSFIDDYEYSSRFEEDVISILKILKYPYASEITKSQLTAITPHIWPIVLSMLSWIVDLLVRVSESNEKKPENDTVESHFLQFVCDGYTEFMRGNEDDNKFEEVFESKVEELYAHMFKRIDEKKEYLSELDNEINDIKINLNGITDLENKRNEILDKLNSLIASEKQLENKKTKYLTTIKKINEEIITFENEADLLRNEQNRLKDKISLQNLNPEDVKVMNKEKVDLYKELEKITPEKEKVMIKNRELEKTYSEILENLLKLIHDYNSLRPHYPVEISKESALEILFIPEFNDLKKSTEEEFFNKKQKEENCKILKETAENDLEEQKNIHKEFEMKVDLSNKKLITTGELYLNKKKMSEDAQRKSKNEMEELISELRTLELESNSSLNQSEQLLQKTKIQFDALKNKIEREKDEISKMIDNFYNNFQSYRKRFAKMNENLKEFLTKLD